MGQHNTIKAEASIKNPQSSNLPVEDRLRIFANLIIDRVLEDYSSGKLKSLEGSSKDG